MERRVSVETLPRSWMVMAKESLKASECDWVTARFFDEVHPAERRTNGQRATKPTYSVIDLTFILLQF